MVFNVEMVCRVRKLVTVECDSEEIARSDPWEHSTDEIEIDQIDWEVASVSKAD